MIREDLTDYNPEAKNETLVAHEREFAVRALAERTKNDMFDPVALLIDIQPAQDKLPASIPMHNVIGRASCRERV